MRALNKVQAGVRWCDIQHYIDPHGLSIKIMQTYANFTVGGALSVNCHGRYIGLGPLILSVRALEVLFANGEIMQVSPTERPDIFYACVGCYNAIAIIVSVTLDLEDNIAVKRQQVKMKGDAYKPYFFENVRENKDVIFHKKVHYRNYEAGYDVMELEPASRKQSTYVLQEYFVPVQKFDAFLALMLEIFIRHNVNVINVSIRHAKADSGSLLAWAPLR